MVTDGDDNEGADLQARAAGKFRFGCLQVFGIIAAVFIVTMFLTAWWVKHNIYASKFTPTELNSEEQEVLDSKLAALAESALKESADKKPGSLEPEPYTEEGAKREISLTEKELNSMIADQPEVAEKVAIDLSDDMVSVKLVVPIDEEVPVLGGKTLRLNLGVILSYEDNQPVVALKGVSLGGIPLPNAWLGNLKEKNLVGEFGPDGGFWDLFAAGVKDLKVKEGQIEVKLRE